MLNLESRQEVLGITVFQDADRPTQFYYLPGSPHISHEGGQPLFDLFTYRKGGEAGATLAGGFLNMVVDVGIGSLQDRIMQKLKEQVGDEVTLVSVPLSKGTARVLALGEDSQAAQGAANDTTPGGSPLVAPGPRFIERILGPGHPSLDGENRTIFSFSLSEDGAAFFLNVLSGDVNARPVGVIYDLEYIGLLPAYDLEITIDFKSSYDYMRSRFTLGTLFFKADVDNIVETLRRQESIKIKEVSRTLELSKPEAIRERQNRIDQLVKDLATGALFQPSLTPGQPKVKDDTITATDPATTTPAAAAPTRAEAALQYGPGAAAAVGTAEMLARYDHAGDATGTSGQPTGQPSGQPAGGQPGGTEQPKGAADVWNALGRPQAAYVLKTIRQEEQRTVTYSLTQVSAQSQTVAPQSFIQFLADRRELSDHVHLVDLDDPFFQRLNINITARDVNFAAEGVSQMTVQLRYGKRPDGTAPKDTAEVILRKAEDSKDFTFFADQDQTQSYEYKLIVDYQHDFGVGLREDRVEGPWTRTEARSLAVHPSWLGRMMPVTLQLAPNLPPDVSEVQATVRYANAERHVDDSTQVQLNAQHREQLVPIRVAGSDDHFEVTVKLFYGDGTSEALPPLRLPDPASGTPDDVVVISAPRANRLDGDIIMLDPLGELQTVVVDTQVLQSNNMVDSHSVELTTPGKREILSVRLPQRDKPAQLRYRQRRIYKDGGLEADDWAEAVAPNLIVGIPAEGVMTVGVSYLGPQPSAVSLQAIVLDLDYADPDGDPKFAQSDTIVITDDPASHNEDWKIRLPHRQARTYRWKLTLLHADGTETSTDFRTDTRDRLILRLPQL